MAVLAKAGAATGRWRSPPPRPSLDRPVRSTALVKNTGELRTAWAPQPGPQTAAIQCTARDLFYGGARGGGKTDFLLGDFAAHAGRYGEHAHGILFRRTYSELEEVEKRALQIYTLLGWKYNRSKRTFVAPNGATLKLRYLLRKTDAANYQGHQYTWMAFDELGNWPDPEPIDLLWACLRSAAGVPCVRRCTGNPGGPGHLWVRKRYVEAHPLGMRHFRYKPQEEENPSLEIEAVYIPSKLDDNLLLRQNDPEYENRIAAAAHGSTALWNAWRHGDWWSVVGAAFEEWRSDVHVQKLRVPTGWRWAAGMDWGYSSFGWFGLAAFGPEGRVHLRWEWYFRKKRPREVGRILGLWMKKNRAKVPLPEYIVLDNAAFARGDGQGGIRMSIAEHIQVGLQEVLKQEAPAVVASPGKTKDSRATRKILLHNVLHFEAEKDGTIDEWNRPMLSVDPACKEFIRTVPALPVDEKDPDLVDTEAEDHPFDGFTYLLIARTPIVDESAVKEREPDQAPEWGERVKESRGWNASDWEDQAAGSRWSRHAPGGS